MTNEEVKDKLPEKSDGLLSRKFIFSTGVFLISTAMLVLGYIVPDIWATIATGSLWAYLTGNVAEKTLKGRL